MWTMSSSSLEALLVTPLMVSHCQSCALSVTVVLYRWCRLRGPSLICICRFFCSCQMVLHVCVPVWNKFYVSVNLIFYIQWSRNTCSCTFYMYIDLCIVESGVFIQSHSWYILYIFYKNNLEIVNSSYSIVVPYISIFRKFSCRTLQCHWQCSTNNSMHGHLWSPDINKFLWMVRIGGSTDRGEHIKEADYYTPQGEFRVDKEGSPTLLNCLMYKMCYYRFGQVYTEAGKVFIFWFMGCFY